MEHTTRVELANLKDLILAEAGVIDPEKVRRFTVEALDLCIDIKKGLIHNPAHNGAWTVRIL